MGISKTRGYWCQPPWFRAARHRVPWPPHCSNSLHRWAGSTTFGASFSLLWWSNNHIHSTNLGRMCLKIGKTDASPGKFRCWRVIKYFCHMSGRISPYNLWDSVAERLRIRVILSNSHIFSNILSNLAAGRKGRKSLPRDSCCRVCFVGHSLGCSLLAAAISATCSSVTPWIIWHRHGELSQQHITWSQLP